MKRRSDLKQMCRQVLIRIFMLIMIIELCIPQNSMLTAQSTSCYKKTESITFSGGTRTVNSVWTNLNDPTIRIETTLAKNQVGSVDSLENIAKSEKDGDSTVLAAINGSFFSAYTDFQPSGTLQVQGETVHISNTGSVFGINGDNQFVIQPLYTKVEGSINESYEWPNSWGAWNVNHLYSDATSTSVFTPAAGGKTPIHSWTSIVVDQKVVTQIVKGQAVIPSTGFVIVSGDSGTVSKFKVGYKVDYRLKYYENTYDAALHSGTQINWEAMRSGAGAGPTLLKNGKIVVDPKKEGFTETKITENRAMRSFIGVTASNMLVMGTVSSVNMKELAEITLKMGLKEAMNLDGGASSGLYFGSAYMSKPGRLLSNAIVIKQYVKRPIRVFLNNKELFFDTEPYLDQANKTLVPMRKIFEALGAKVTYDAKTKAITAVKAGKTIVLTMDSNQAYVDGETYTLDSQVVSKNGRTMVPLRFVTEQFGGIVTWLKDQNAVALQVDSVVSEEQIEQWYITAKANLKAGKVLEAEELYQKVLSAQPTHLDALKAMAQIEYSNHDFAASVAYYETILTIEPNNFSMWGSLGWAATGIPDLEKSIQAFEKQIQLDPKNVSGYYGLGLMYSYLQVQDLDKMKENFTIALTLNPSAAQKALMEKYMLEK